MSVEGFSSVGPAAATLTVGAPPTVGKSFNPSTINAGDTSTLTIALGNTKIRLMFYPQTFRIPCLPIYLLWEHRRQHVEELQILTAYPFIDAVCCGSIPGGGCTITGKVTPSTAGSYLNTTSTLSVLGLSPVGVQSRQPYQSRSISSARMPIVIREGQQVTEFRDGILPWAYQHNVALVFDEYDAGRPDVMFVIQRVLESSGRRHLARPEQGHQAASRLPPVRDRKHGGPRRHLRPLSWHATDQPGADGPLVDCHHPELPSA